jgi:hypothetical protein
MDVGAAGGLTWQGPNDDNIIWAHVVCGSCTGMVVVVVVVCCCSVLRKWHHFCIWWCKHDQMDRAQCKVYKPFFFMLIPWACPTFILYKIDIMLFHRLIIKLVATGCDWLQLVLLLRDKTVTVTATVCQPIATATESLVFSSWVGLGCGLFWLVQLDLQRLWTNTLLPSNSLATMWKLT